MMGKNHITHTSGRISGLAGILAIFLLQVSVLHAGTADSVKIQRPGQISFIYPLGTNGIDSYKYSNHFSLNILAGITGGTSGFEAGGLINIDRGPVTGFQTAGLVNMVSGSFRGSQFAGLVNLNEQRLKGAQFAGLVNVESGDVTGLQVAGLVNVSTKNGRGAAFAGIANIQSGYYNGLQGGGLVNITANKHNGVQLAGLVNVSSGKMEGFQAGGLANISPRDMHGAQVAGIINYTKNLNGFQLGLVNYSDSIGKGVPLGFLSIVKHGYRRMEWEVNETFLANLTFKTGTSRLYNIFSVGYHFSNEQYLWGVTYGLGTCFPSGSRTSINLDLTTTQLNDNEAWTNYLNLVNKLKMSVGFKPGKHLELFTGISLIAHVSDHEKNGSRDYGWLSITDITFYEDNHNGTDIRLYPGIHGGIRF